MDAVPKGDTAVWYYRENAAGEAPAAAIPVMQLIAERRLPLRLYTRPDFLDGLAPDAVGWAALLATVRVRAAGAQLVIVYPDGRQMAIRVGEKETVLPEGVAAVRRSVPSETPRNVAVFADTSWTAGKQPDLQDAARAFLLWHPDGHRDDRSCRADPQWGRPALAECCRDADLAIVDSARLEALPTLAEWVRPTMRTPKIESTIAAPTRCCPRKRRARGISTRCPC